ncbi:uncharacterized protein MYCGRDRAFT_91930 [Zymoseptoria tritici IPO323]|uniref:Uncharacterized protein n=1 Tax=Zymoseptoria tritici (strain CBS 115943 / IPO323) TaxID=336722 RepID=F9X7X5_ZYMTI|nr:uncharacterized protein MYCGRDRAFT_91930 [Zymoseptoria tritici IPO323]EGP89279.1 hypothetical protein MYCGRDRAFT_91930 [Zymoseptoria tritici IPO323]
MLRMNAVGPESERALDRNVRVGKMMARRELYKQRVCVRFNAIRRRASEQWKGGRMQTRCDMRWHSREVSDWTRARLTSERAPNGDAHERVVQAGRRSGEVRDAGSLQSAVRRSRRREWEGTLGWWCEKEERWPRADRDRRREFTYSLPLPRPAARSVESLNLGNGKRPVVSLVSLPAGWTGKARGTPCTNQILGAGLVGCGPGCRRSVTRHHVYHVPSMLYSYMRRSQGRAASQPLRFMGPAHVVPLPPSRVPTPERTTADLSNAIPRDCAEPFSVAREEPPPALAVASGTSNLSRPLMQ